MVIFNSYVKLPKGTCLSEHSATRNPSHGKLWCSPQGNNSVKNRIIPMESPMEISMKSQCATIKSRKKALSNSNDIKS
jgi:hypothetical protein